MESVIDKSTKRIEFIDLAKGVCILLVICYHCGLVNIFPGDKQLRMPLYFVLSGLFFKDYGRESICKKINKLIIPFVTFYILGDLFYWGAYKLGFLPVSPKEFPVIDILWKGIPSNLPIWFLVCLFECYLIFLLITRLTKNEISRFLLIVLCGIGGYSISQITDGAPTYYWGSALSAMPFFYMGYALKRTAILPPCKLDKFNILFAFLCFGLAYLLMVILPDSKISMFDNVFYGNPLAAYFISALLVMTVLFLCKTIGKLPYVSYVGRYSVIVLLIQVPIMEIAYYFQRSFFHNESHFLRAVLTALIASAFIPLFKRYFPYVTAQKDLLKYDHLIHLCHTLKLKSIAK